MSTSAAPEVTPVTPTVTTTPSVPSSEFEMSNLPSPFPRSPAEEFGITPASPAKPTVKPAVTPTVTQTTTTTTPEVKTTRDLTGVPAEYHDYMKQMSLDAFNKFKPLVTDIAEGKLLAKDKVAKDIEAAQLEQHPRGFVLSKEFEEVTSQHATAQTLIASLEESILQIEEGKPFQLEVERNGKTVKQTFAPTAKNKLLLTNLYNNKTTEAAQLEQRLAQMEKDHAKNHGTRTTDITDFEAKLFTQVEKAPGFKKLHDAVLEDQNIPATMRRSPLFSFLSKQIALNMLLMEQLHARTQSDNQTKALAGATPQSVQTGGDVAADRAMNALRRNRALFGMAEAA